MPAEDFPQPGTTDYEPCLYGLTEALTGVVAKYEVDHKGDLIITVVGWWDDAVEGVRTETLCWSTRN